VLLHRLSKVPVIWAAETQRIIGRIRDQHARPLRPSSVILSASALPIGHARHAADTYAFIAVATPVKVTI
jgi:hypothetical protein